MKLAVQWTRGCLDCAILYKAVFECLLRENKVSSIEWTVKPSATPQSFFAELIYTLQVLVDHERVKYVHDADFLEVHWNDLARAFSVPSESLLSPPHPLVAPESLPLVVPPVPSAPGSSGF